MKKICLALLLIMLLSGCSTKTETIALNTSIKTEDDIRITFSGQQTVYKASTLNEDNLFDYQIIIEYVGDEDETMLYHGGLAAVTMKSVTGATIVNTGITSELTTTVLKKNKPIIIPWDGAAEFKNEKTFDKGIYTVKALVIFRLNENESKDNHYTLELPLIIE